MDKLEAVPHDHLELDRLYALRDKINKYTKDIHIPKTSWKRMGALVPRRDNNQNVHDPVLGPKFQPAQPVPGDTWLHP